MARDDEDDRIQDRHSRRPPSGAARRGRRRDDDDDDDDNDDDEYGYDPRRSADAPALIPYKNPSGLIAYYLGVFSLIPCLGLILGPAAIVLGILGIGYANREPRAKGKGHAIAGIVLGSLALLYHVGGFLFLFLSGSGSR